MKTLKLVVLVSFCTFISCKKTNDYEVKEFEFAVYENAPMFIDEYMYDKEVRQAKRITVNDIEWFLIDWNKNGRFNDIGIDYFGVKSAFRKRPICEVLKQQNYLNHNLSTYLVDKESEFLIPKHVEYNPTNSLSYITEFIPLELGDGTLFNNSDFKKYNKTVIYFWATWCKPCLRTLDKVNKESELLNSKRINFIPIYYQSSHKDVEALFTENNYSFKPIGVSDRGALTYHLESMPTVYVFNSEGKLIAEDFELDMMN